MSDDVTATSSETDASQAIDPVKPTHRRGGTFAPGNDYAIKPGEVKNKTGGNHWVKAQLRFQEFARQVSGEDGQTRDDRVLLAIYANALKPGGAGAADRRLWMEHMRGKPRQQVEVSGELKSGLQDGVASRLRADIAIILDAQAGNGGK